MRRNFAESPAGYPFTAGRTDYSVLSEGLQFDARDNLEGVLQAVAARVMPSEGLLYEAALAVQRQSVLMETPEEWADRLSKSFVADLG